MLDNVSLKCGRPWNYLSAMTHDKAGVTGLHLWGHIDCTQPSPGLLCAHQQGIEVDYPVFAIISTMGTPRQAMFVPKAEAQIGNGLNRRCLHARIDPFPSRDQQDCREVVKILILPHTINHSSKLFCATLRDWSLSW